MSTREQKRVANFSIRFRLVRSSEAEKAALAAASAVIPAGAASAKK